MATPVRNGCVRLLLTLGASLARNLMRLVDVLPSSYLVGLVSMLVTAEGKRLGDLAAGTIVVRIDRLPSVRPLAVANEPGAPAFGFRREQIARPAEELNPPPLVTGDDLIRAGVKAGRQFAPLLEHLRDRQLEGELALPAEAIVAARQWLAEHPKPR